MNKTMFMALAATAMLLAGCEYEAPLVKDHTIPVDAELLGVWVPVSATGVAAATDENLMVLRYSDTEYMIHHPANDEGIYYRGYPIKIGSVACVQLEAIGTAEGPVGKDEKERYHVASYTIANGSLEVRTLNAKVVSDEFKTTEELHQAFLKNIGNKELFNPEPSRFRRAKPE
ncbi:hypothetical protein [Pontiella sp.]|uniref:hypothetical protein n=1 Tax=Pontiella sp. TaxID=2837462 RepID=UPI003566D64C